MKKLFLSIAITCLCFIALSQFSIDAQIRPRTELYNGYKGILKDTLNGNAFQISQRSRIGINFKHEKTESRIAFQDVRVWGDESLYSSTGVSGNDASIDLFEAWIIFHISEHLKLKLGRQEISLDDQRLISKRNWNQYGCAYNAGLFTFISDKNEAKLALSWNNDGYIYTGNSYNSSKMKTLDFLYLKHNFSEKFYISCLSLVNGYYNNTKNKIYFTHTIGPFVQLNNDFFGLTTNVFYQHGANKNSETVNAYFLHTKLDFILQSFKFSIAADYASGDDNPNSGTDKSFDILYGGRHKFYGDMDLFSNLDKSTNSAGLSDAYVITECKQSSKLKYLLMLHYFQTNEIAFYPNNNRSINKKLGYEIDFNLNYKIFNELELKSGMSYFIPTPSLQYITNGDSASKNYGYFIWLELTYLSDFTFKK